MVWRLIVCAMVLCSMPAVAWADGGTVRVQAESEGMRITLFTAPAPLVAGPADLSVFVEDLATGHPRTDLPVAIELAPEGGEPEQTQTLSAERAGVNQLLHTVNLHHLAAGTWHFQVRVDLPNTHATVRGSFPVALAPPPWRALWPWYTWPFLIVAVFLWYRWPSRRNVNDVALLSPGSP